MKTVYNMPFYAPTIKKHLNGVNEYYGEIILNDVLTKLHWKYR